MSVRSRRLLGESSLPACGLSLIVPLLIPIVPTLYPPSVLKHRQLADTCSEGQEQLMGSLVW